MKPSRSRPDADLYLRKIGSSKLLPHPTRTVITYRTDTTQRAPANRRALRACCSWGMSSPDDLLPPRVEHCSMLRGGQATGSLVRASFIEIMQMAAVDSRVGAEGLQERGDDSDAREAPVERTCEVRRWLAPRHRHGESMQASSRPLTGAVGDALCPQDEAGADAMRDNGDIRERPAKIEALFARGATAGERAAAGAALQRLKARLDPSANRPQEPEIELQYSLPDVWSVRLFVAVCRKHCVRPYRYPRQRRTTVMVRARKCEFQTTIAAEFNNASQGACGVPRADGRAPHQQRDGVGRR